MTFNDLYDKLKSYELKLTTKEQLVQFFDENLVVKEYVPIINKYSTIGIIINTYKQQFDSESSSDNFSSEYIYMKYEVCKLFNILFRYIDIVVPMEKQTMKNYDLVMDSGLYSYIVSRCKFDYEDFSYKCDRASGIDNLQIVHEFISTIRDTFSLETVEGIRKEVNKLDMRKLKLLESVAQFNDPITAQVVDVLKNENTSKIDEQLKNDSELNSAVNSITENQTR